MTINYLGPKWREVNPSDHYVYIHFKLSTGYPFYVGLGQNGRAWHSSPDNRSEWWMRTAKKHGFSVKICQDGLTRGEAILLEMWLIAKLRNQGHTLVNMTDGGEGALGGPGSGHKPVCCSNGMCFPSIADAVRWVSSERGDDSAASSAISHAAGGILNSAYGYAWWYVGDKEKEYIHNRARSATSNKKPVRSSMGMAFDSVSDAADWLRGNGWNKASKGNICRAIKTKGSCCGSSWWYDGDEPVEYVSHVERSTLAKHKMIIRGDGVSFASATHAVDDLIASGNLKASKSAITRASKSPRLTAYGYTWRYAELRIPPAA